MHIVTVIRIRASALIAMGDQEQAIELVERGIELAREQELDYDAALLLMVKAQLVRPFNAKACTGCELEASAIFERLGVRYEKQFSAPVRG